MVYKILSILTLVYFAIIFGCSSPLEVPANRQIDLEDNPYVNPIIKIDPSFIDFGYVHLDSSKIFSIQIENNQDKKYLISNYFLFFGNKNFQILNKEIPIILEPKGEPNSKRQISIKFTGKSIGTFADTLILSNIVYPIALFEAKVPYVYINDYYQNNLKSGKKYLIELTLTNISEENAIINKVSFKEKISNFSIKTPLPLELPRNSKKNLVLEFYSDKSGVFESQIQLEIQTNANRKLVDSLSTIKIECN